MLDNNPIMDHFYGIIPVTHGTALYHFIKSGRVQNIMHNLKYRNMPSIGIELGKMLGKKLQESTHYRNLDLVVPIPLHPRKEKLRGFNQSEKFAMGLTQSMGIFLENNTVKRIKNTPSQTKLSREDRMENVKDAFQIIKAKAIKDKNILLVDDVLTTGSTLIECGKALLKGGCKKLFIATIAVGDY